MDDAGHLAHVVPPAAGEVGEGAAGVGEGADAEHGRGFGEEHGAVEGDVRVAGADVELVGLARDQGPAVQGGDADALRDGGDFVEGVVCVNGLGWLGWVGKRWCGIRREGLLERVRLTEGSDDVRGVAWGGVGHGWGHQIGARCGWTWSGQLLYVQWMIESWGGRRKDRPLALKASGPAWSLIRKGSSSPSDLGMPSGFGWQKYAGTNEPLVKASVGTTVASPSMKIERRAIGNEGSWESGRSRSRSRRRSDLIRFDFAQQSQ